MCILINNLRTYFFWLLVKIFEHARNGQPDSTDCFILSVVHIFTHADENDDQYDYYMMTTEDDVPVDIDADKSLGTVGFMCVTLLRLASCLGVSHWLEGRRHSRTADFM